MRLTRILLTISTLLFLFSNLSAQKTWDGGGDGVNWSDDANWLPDGQPTLTDDVVIDEGLTITIDANAQCQSLTFTDNALAISISINSGVTLDVDGLIQFGNPSVNNENQTLDVGDGNLNCLGVDMPNTGSNTQDLYLYFNDGTITVDGDIIMRNGNQNRVQAFGTGTLNVSGAFQGGRFDRGNSTVNYNGTGDQTIWHTNYHTLQVSNGGIKSLRANSIVYGGLILDNILNLNGYQFRVYRSYISTSGSFGLTSMLDFSSGGNLRIDGLNNTHYETVFPIGMNGEYSPIQLTSVAGTNLNGYFQVTVTDSRHPLAAGSDNAITRYWDVLTPGLTLTSISGFLQYTNNDVLAPIVETNLTTVGRLSSAGWQTNETGTSYNHTSNRIILSAASAITGSWTLGEDAGCFDGTLPDKYTVNTGNWNTGSIWNGGTVPAPTDDVSVLHAVTLNTAATVNSLTIQPGGNLNLNNQNFTVTTTTDVYDVLIDANNGGTNTFTGAFTVHSGGSYSTNNRSPHNFEGGITNNGTFDITNGSAVVNFITNNQVIDGNATATINGTITVASGISLTNRITEATTGLLINGYLNGADGTAQFINENILSVGGQDGPMRTTGVFDASFAGNVVYYIRENTQYITPGTYHDLICISTGNRYRILEGTTTVNNDLQILGNIYFDPSGQDMNVTGHTTIDALIYDRNIAGTVTLNTVDLSNGQITGNNTGVFIINGDLAMPTGGGIIGRGDFTINGNTNVADGSSLSFNNANGTKTFVGAVDISGPTGQWLNTGNESIEFQNGLQYYGNTFTSGTGTYSFTTNNQSITGASAITFSRDVQVGAGITLSNENTEGTTGVTIQGDLLGADAGSVYQNRGITTYLDYTIPMDIGTLDASSFPNTFDYNLNNTQLIKDSDYDNLIFSNSGNKILQDSTTVNGTFSTSGGANTVCGTADLTLLGVVNNTSTGTFVTGVNTVAYGRAGDQDVITGTYGGELILSGAGIKTVQGNSTIVGNILIDGTSEFNLNGNTVTTAGDITINSGTQLTLGPLSQLEIANARTITNNGTFYLVGDAVNNAVLTQNGAGGYSIVQNNAAAVFHAQYYLIEYLAGGLSILDGQINATNNFSNGTFTNGTGTEYLNLTGLNVTGLPNILNTVFDAGPTYNVTRTSGTGTVTFADASGALAGENFDNDNGIPGTLINWTYPSRTFYSNGNPEAGLVTSWTRNPDGTGANPTSVSDGLNTLIVQDGHTLIVDNNGDLNVLNLQIGEGTSGTLRIGADASQRSVTVQQLLDVQSGATLNAGSAGSPTHNLYIYGILNNDGTINLRPSPSDIVNVEFYGNSVISGTSSPIFNDVTFKSGCDVTANAALDINGNVFVETTAIFQDGGLEHFVAGNWSFNGNGSVSGTGIINFDGLVNTINDNPSATSVSFGNVTFSGGGAGSIQENIIFNGNLLIANNTSVTVANLSVTSNANFTVEAGASYNHTANNTFFYGTSAQTIDLSGTASFNGIVFDNGSPNAKTIVGNIDANGRINIYSGATVNGAGDHTVDGGLLVDGTCNWSGSVTMTGNQLFTTNASNTLTLGTAVLNVDGGVTLNFIAPATSVTANINNDVNIYNGYILLNDNTTFIGQPGNTLHADPNTSIYVRGPNNFPSGFGTYDFDVTSWVRYDAPFDQTVRGVPYGNLEIDGTGTTNTVDGPIDVDGNLDLNAASTLDLQNFIHSFAGNIYNNTNSSIAGPLATVSLDADDADQIIEASGTGSYSFNNLSITINGASANRTKSFYTGSTITINGGNLDILNIGGSAAIGLIVDLNDNAIGGTPNNITVGEYCQINTDLVDFGADVTDNFSGTRQFDVNSTVYYSLGTAQTIADGFTYGNITFAGGDKTARGALDIDGHITRTAGTPVFYDAGYTHTLAGDWLLNSPNYYTQASATGTITFDGVDQNIDGDIFNNIIVDNTGIANIINNLIVYGNHQVNSGATIDYSTRNLNLAGNFSVLGAGLYAQTTGTTTFDGATNQTLTSNATSNLGQFVINKPNLAGLQTVTVLSELHVSGNSTITTDAGILDISNQDVYFAGRLYVEPNVVEVGPTFISTGSNVYFDGSDAQYIQNANVNPLTFNNIFFSGGGDKAIDIDNDRIPFGNKAMEVNGNFTIDGSVVTAAGWNDGGMDIYVRGDWNNTGTFQHGNNDTVFFDGAADQDISSSAFWNIKINGSNSKILQGNITVNNSVTISSGTFDANDYNITVDGNWDNRAAGAVFAPGTGKVIFNGADARIYTGVDGAPVAGKSFYDVDINKNTGRAFLGGDIEITNDLNIVSGPFRTDTNNVWLGGNFINTGTLEHNNNASLFTFNATSGTKTIDANGATFRGIEVNAPGVTYIMQSNFRFTNENFTLTDGTFILAENQIDVLNNSDSIVINGGVFDVDTGSVIEFFNNNQAIRINGGEFRIVGNASKLATLTRGTNRFSLLQTGGTFHAQYYLIRNGNLTHTGGTIDATDNFSNGTFAAGGGNAYLTLTGLNFADFTATNVTFNSGPTYNVSRTSGTGVITFEDAAGTLAGENFDEDDGDPGTLIMWTFPSGFFWDGGALTENWNDANNWSGNVVPTATDIVYLDHTFVATPYTVRITSAQAEAFRLFMDDEGTGNAIELILENGYDLDIEEHIQLESNTTLSVTDNTNTINVGKNWTNSGTFNHGNSTVTFDGPAGNYIIDAGGQGAGKSFYNFVINSAPTATYNLGNLADVDNDLTVTNGTFNLAAAAYDLVVGGDWFIDQATGGVFDASTADVTFDGAGNQGITNGVFYNLLTAGSGTKTLNSNIQVDNDLTIGINTTLDGLENNILVADDWTNNGSFTQTGLGTVQFNGIGGWQVIDNGTNATIFNHVTLMNSRGKTFARGSSIAGDLTINGGSGTVVMPDSVIVSGLGGTNSFTSFGTLRLQGTNNFPSGFETISLANTSWVEYRANIDQDIYVTTYGNLRLRGESATPVTKTALGDLIITGTLDIDDVDSTTFDAATNDVYITLTGNLGIRPDCDIIWGTNNSTIEHVGGNWNIDADLDSLNNVILAGTGDKYMQGNLLIGGDVTIKNGIDLMMYATSGRADFRNMTGDAANTITLEQGGRILNTRPATDGPAIPEGFGTYSFDDNSTYFLYSLAGTDQELYTGASYGNLYFREIKNVTSDGLGTLDVNGDFDIDLSTYIDNGMNMDLAGANIYLTNYAASDTSIVVTLDGIQNQYLRDDRTNVLDIPRLVLAGAGIKTIGDGNDAVNMTGNFIINSGVVGQSNRVIIFTGTQWLNNGVYTQTGNSTTFSGGNDQVIDPGATDPSNNFRALIFDNASTKTFINNGADINGNFTINAGTVDLGAVDHTISGTITNILGGTLLGASANLTLDGGNQNVNSPAFTINNITTFGTGTKYLYSDWTINGDLTINAATALNTSDGGTIHDIFIAGNWTNSGTFIDNTGTVTFNGSTSPISITTDGDNFYDLVFAPTAAVSYSMQSTATSVVNTLDIGANALLDLNSTTLQIGRNVAGNTVNVDGTLTVDENATLNFDNRTAQCIMNVGGRLELIGASASDLAVLSRNNGTVGTQVNILSGGIFAAQYYLIEHLDLNGINMQAGSTLDATYNMSDGTWSNLLNTANARYITLEANYAGDTIRNVSFNFSGTPTQGTHYNVWRQTANPDIVFDIVSGNLGSYLFENDEEAVPSATSGRLQWPAIVESYWTGAINTNWHLDGNWDNGVPDQSIDAIIPDRANDPIISDADAECRNLIITNGTLEIDNNRLLDARGDVTIATSTNVGILSVNTPNSEITVGGNWTQGTNGIFLHGNSTVIFNSGAGSATITPRTSDFYNVVFNNAITTFFLSGTTINFDGKFEVLNGTVMPSTNNYTYNVSGDITINGGFFFPTQGGVTAGTFILDGADQDVTNGYFHHVQVSGTGTKTFIDSAAVNGTTTINSTLTANTGCIIDFNGNFYLDAAGTFNDGNEIHTFGGQRWDGYGTYAGNGTILFDRTNGDQYVYAGNFYDVDVNCTGRRLFLWGDITVGNNMTIHTGINYAYMYDNLITNSSGTGTFTLEDNVRFYVTGANNFPKNFGIYNLSASSTTYYYGSIDQNIDGLMYGNLLTNYATTKTLTGDVEVKGYLTFNSSTIDVSANNYTLIVGGSWNNNSTGNFIGRTGEVIFNGGANQPINVGASNINDFYDLTVNKSGGYAYANNNTTNDFTINNNLNVTAGQFSANGRTVYIGGDMTASATGTFRNNTGTYYLNKTSGTANISTNGSSLLNMIINAGTTNYTVLDDFNLIGDFTLTSGTFNGNGNTVILGNGNSDVINISGTYQVGSGGTLAIGYYTSLTVDAGGSIEIVGSPSGIAQVTRRDNGRYNFTVNGNIAARYYSFEYMNTTGIYLSGTATIDATNNFSDGTFTRGPNSGQLFRVENTQSFQGTDSIANVSFPINPGGSAANVSKITAVTGDLEFYNATGEFAGESYDNDPSDRIHWTGPIILTWNGSVSTDWNDSLNWTASYGPPIVPTGAEDVIIAAALNQPILTTFGQITANLNIESGATLRFNTPADANEIDLDVNGDFTIENGGSLQLLSTGDYLNVEGNWEKQTSGTTIIDGNVTFDGAGGAKTIDNGNSPFYNLTIAGYSLYQLARATYVDNDLVVADTSTLDVTTADYALYIDGDFYNYGTFQSQNGKVNFLASSGPRTIINNSDFYDIDINASGVTYQLGGNVSVNRNLNIINGTLDLNGNTLNMGDGAGTDYLTVNGTLNIGPNDVLSMGNNAQININSGATLYLVGTDNSNRASVNSQSGGRYSFDINSGGTIHANFYDVAYTDADGLHINSGATVDAANNLSNGQFSNGSPASGAYLKLSHDPGSNDTIRNCIFNAGPTYNVSRTAGTAVFFFQDATGALGTYDYEQDVGVPDPSSGLIQWPLLNTNVWIGVIDSDWHKAGNWGGGEVPDLTRNAIIAPAVNDPVISTAVANAKTVSVQSGASLTISQDLNVAENFSYADAVTAAGTPTITVAEDWQDIGGTFTPGNSTVIMSTASGTNDIDISSGSFYNLEIDAAGANYLIYNYLNVDNNLTITNGTLDLNGNDLDIAGGLTISGGTLNIGASLITFDGSSGTHLIDAPGTVFPNILFNSPTGNATYRLNNNLSISNDITITDGALELSPDNGTTNYALTVGNRVTITSGEIFAHDGTIQVGENWSNNVLGTFDAGTSTVTFVSNSGTRSITAAGDAFYDIDLNGNATFRLTGDITVQNDLTISNGSFDLATGPSYNVAVGGNWDNSGIFNARAGTVTFNGTSQSITNALGETFYNLLINSGTLALNNNVTVSNNLTMTAGVVDAQTNLFMLGTGTTNTGTLFYTDGAIIGQFERWVNTIETDYIFPLGTATTANASTVRFVTSLTDGSIVGEFVASNPGTAGLPVVDGTTPVDNVFTEGFWRFSAKNSMASTDYNITLIGQGFTSRTFEPSNRVLKRTNGGNWGLDGTHVAAVDTSIFRNTLDGISTTTTDFCIGVISCVGGTIGDIDTVCAGDDLAPFTSYVPASGGTGYTYTWQETNVLTAVPGDANWTNIAASNVEALDYGIINDTTIFVRRAVAAGCPTTYSNTVQIVTYRVPQTGPVFHRENQ
jgi:hypothetical protein